MVVNEAEKGWGSGQDDAYHGKKSAVRMKDDDGTVFI